MRILVIALLTLASVSELSSAQGREQGFVPPVTAQQTSQPLANFKLLSTLPSAAIASVPKPLELRILILSADGTEPGLAALRSFLDYQGTPYDVVRPALREPLPTLSDGTRGFYNGLILTSGNLGICDPTCHSALSADNWTTIETYSRDYRVRIASYYTFPEPRFGLTYTSSRATTSDAPMQAKLTSAGSEIFSYLRPSAVISISNAFVYLSNATPSAGEETVPLLVAEGGVIGAVSKKADGREYLAVTMDNNSNLLHSQALTYGIVRWVTRGLFLGFRKAFLAPQVDDMFLPSILFNGNQELCRPGSEAFDPRNPLVTACSVVRISGSDLEGFVRWQTSWRDKAQFSAIRASLVFNGYGARAQDDELRDKALANVANFYWINHTYDHRSLDCFAPTTDGCRPANVEESVTEIADNIAFANRWGLPADATSLVTPMITGLTNPDWLKAAAKSGIRYLVADGSRPEGTAAFPNTPITSMSEPSVLLVPRRPTNVFFQASQVDSSRDGSEVDEFNFIYGPAGLLRVGGSGGRAFFATNQTYDQIVSRESDLLAGYLFRGDMSPLMFHQTNLYRYSADHSLLSDLLDATLGKWEGISNLPVISLTQSAIGAMLEQRQAFVSANAKALWIPGVGVQLEAERAATIPVTGLCAKDSCESYGPDSISYIRLDAGSRVTIELR